MALRNLIKLINIQDLIEKNIILIIRKISLMRLRNGGVAILAEQVKNHIIERWGKIVAIPLVRNTLRVIVVW